MNEPCAACPIHTWNVIREGTEAERAIRADQRSLDLRELQATARDLAWVLNQIEKAPNIDHLDMLRAHTRRLITLARRKAAA